MKTMYAREIAGSKFHVRHRSLAVIFAPPTANVRLSRLFAWKRPVRNRPLHPLEADRGIERVVEGVATRGRVRRILEKSAFREQQTVPFETKAFG